MDLDAPKKEYIKKSGRKDDKNNNREPFPIKKTTIDKIIYPVKTKRGLKYGKKVTNVN